MQKEEPVMISYRHYIQEDKTVLARLVAESFHMEQEVTRNWIERTGPDNWRVLEDPSGGLLGGLLMVPMGQWFGGKVVPMTGLAAVVVSPGGRGRRSGQHMIRECLTEMRSNGVGLSALYGSTTSFYRRCGYERAGSRFMAEAELPGLSFRAGPLEVKSLEAGGHIEAERLQADHVRGQGCLLRGEYVWKRVRAPRGKIATGYGFYRGPVLEGYIYLVRESSSLERSLEVTDVLVTTPDSVSTLLGFLAGHRAVVQKARWPSLAISPILMSMKEPWQYSVRLSEHWMLRIVDLGQALTQRGYPQQLRLELHLSVDDPWFEENSGAWVLTVQDGRGVLERGGRGDLKIEIGALASLYSGFISAEDLRLTGGADGNAETLALASSVFGGVTPQLLDFF